MIDPRIRPLEALIAHWRAEAARIAMTSTLNLMTACADLKRLNQCADQLEALLRSFVREGAEIEPPETTNNVTRSVELGDGPAPQHAASDEKGSER
jgi:hypothetical protein